MDNGQNARHPLEDFPFGNLSGGITRRQFYSVFIKEVEMYLNRHNGRVAVKLSTLGALPVEQLLEIIPVIKPGCQIIIKEQSVWGSGKNNHSPLLLFQIDPISLEIFNHINGRNSIRQIADELAENRHLPLERSRRITRGLFLTLVKAGVCVPANNPFIG